MKPTLETIAEKTGYSISTVSRALAGKAEKFRISETAAETIRKTAAELGYTSYTGTLSNSSLYSETVSECESLDSACLASHISSYGIV